MANNTLKAGIKLDVTYIDASGKRITLKSAFEKNVDSVCILITRPLMMGKPAEIDSATRLTLSGGQGLIVNMEGYVDATMKIGPRSYWKFHKVTQTEHSDQRLHERYKAELPVEVQKTYWNADQTSSIEAFPGLTLDISTGGVAIYLNAAAAGGEILELVLPKQKRLRELSLRGEVCWMREAEKASAYRYILGVRFILDDKNEQDRLTRYVAAVAAKPS